jgi:hypothetical protein
MKKDDEIHECARTVVQVMPVNAGERRHSSESVAIYKVMVDSRLTNPSTWILVALYQFSHPSQTNFPKQD